MVLRTAGWRRAETANRIPVAIRNAVGIVSPRSSWPVEASAEVIVVHARHALRRPIQARRFPASQSQILRIHPARGTGVSCDWGLNGPGARLAQGGCCDR